MSSATANNWEHIWPQVDQSIVWKDNAGVTVMKFCGWDVPLGFTKCGNENYNVATFRSMRFLGICWAFSTRFQFGVLVKKRP